ncbi:MAG: PrsW family intramembrane metalloprotease [Deltaproteobacteria bacterium]|nr:PrsW family intramembrane metalloprotease [Deltaproteobacteria bacterium]
MSDGQPGASDPKEAPSALAGSREGSRPLRLRYRGASGDAFLPLASREALIIGRSAQAALRLTGDPRVSRAHAELVPAGESWMIRNKSHLGTLLNGAPVAGTQMLKVGDEIRIGQTTLRFEADPEHDEASSILGSAPSVIAATSAGYDENGLFHAGYTHEAPSGPGTRMLDLPSFSSAPVRVRARAAWFAAVMGGSALAGSLVVAVALLLPMLRGSPERSLAALALALGPAIPYLAIYKALDRNDRIARGSYLACFAWGATTSCALSVLLNSIGKGLLAKHLGADSVSMIGAIVLAPLVEETTKGLAVLAVFAMLRDELEGSVSGLVLGAASGLGFALVENWVYGTRALSNGVGLPSFLADGTFRSLACALVGHPIYTSMIGLGFGVFRELGPRHPLRLFPIVAGGLGAVMMHAAWNAAAMSLPPAIGPLSGQMAILGVLAVLDAIFLLLVLLYSLDKERRMLISQLSDEVQKGFIEPDELMSFRSLLGRERFVRAGRALGTHRLRRELRRAQVDLAFRKWHLSLGEELRTHRESESKVDKMLMSARLRIRDARNAINEAEGVVSARSSPTLEPDP